MAEWHHINHHNCTFNWEHYLRFCNITLSLSDPSETSKFYSTSARQKVTVLSLDSYFGPSVWNSLPLHIRNATTIDTFKSALKTNLFSLQESDWLISA